MLVDGILNFFSINFSNLSWLAVLIIAMLPIAEAKVAIPFAMSTQIWGSAALSPFMAALVSFVGSMLPAFFIILFLRPLFNWLKKSKYFKKFILYFENFFKSKAEKKKENKKVHAQTTGDSNLNKSNYVATLQQDKQKSKAAQILSLIFFVAIPLPLAGVWTSSAIAAFSDIKFWPSVAAIAFGNLLEVVFVTVLCVLLIDSITIVLSFTLILVAVYVFLMVVLHSVKSKEQNAKNGK